MHALVDSLAEDVPDEAACEGRRERGRESALRRAAGRLRRRRAARSTRCRPRPRHSSQRASTCSNPRSARSSSARPSSGASSRAARWRISRRRASWPRSASCLPGLAEKGLVHRRARRLQLPPRPRARRRLRLAAQGRAIGAARASGRLARRAQRGRTSSSATTSSRRTGCEPSWVGSTAARGGSQPTPVDGWAPPASRPGSAATRRRPSTCSSRATGLLPERDSYRLELCCELGLALLTAGELRPRRGDARRSRPGRSRRRRSPTRPARSSRARLSTPVQRSRRAAQTELLDAAARALPVFDAVEDYRSLGRAWLTLSFVHGLMHCRHAAAIEAAECAMDFYRRSGWPVSACLASLSAAAQNGAMPTREAARRCRQLLAQGGSPRRGERPPVAGRTRSDAWALGRGPPSRCAGADDLRPARPARARADQLRDRSKEESNCLPATVTRRSVPSEQAARRSSAWAVSRTSRRGRRSSVTSVYGLGHYDEAERLSHRAEELGATDDVLTQVLWRSLRARVLARQGRIVEAEELIGEATQLADDTDALNLRAKVLLDRAEVLQFAGRSERGRRRAGVVDPALRAEGERRRRKARTTHAARARPRPRHTKSPDGLLRVLAAWRSGPRAAAVSGHPGHGGHLLSEAHSTTRRSWRPKCSLTNR